MGQKYAGPGLNGHTISFYDDEIHTLIPDGTVPISQEDWIKACREQGWTFVDGKVVPKPPMTAQEIVMQQKDAAVKAAFNIGLTISVPDNLSLNGTYPVDKGVQNQINVVETHIAKTGNFPGSSGVLAWKDINGVVHMFSSVQHFEAFSTAVANYIADLDLYAAGVCPSPPIASVVIS
jgi:hypothetical protein